MLFHWNHTTENIMMDIGSLMYLTASSSLWLYRHQHNITLYVKSYQLSFRDVLFICTITVARWLQCISSQNGQHLNVATWQIWNCKKDEARVSHCNRPLTNKIGTRVGLNL